MKRFIFTALLCVFFATPVFADWQADFPTTYQDQGIEQAVVDALTDGGSPEEIIAEGQKIEGLDMEALLLALYNAGANEDDIRNAALAAGISVTVLDAAYEESLAARRSSFTGLPGAHHDPDHITYNPDLSEPTPEPTPEPVPTPNPTPTPEPIPPDPSSPSTF